MFFYADERLGSCQEISNKSYSYAGKQDCTGDDTDFIMIYIFYSLILYYVLI